jgi:hypothetical protein
LVGPLLLSTMLVIAFATLIVIAYDAPSGITVE